MFDSDEPYMWQDEDIISYLQEAEAEAARAATKARKAADFIDSVVLPALSRPE